MSDVESESNETKACTACYWHLRIPTPHDKAGMHVCIHPSIREAMPDELIAAVAGELRCVNCDLARRMDGPCGPRGREWISKREENDAFAVVTARATFS